MPQRSGGPRACRKVGIAVSARRGAASASQGHACKIFRRALERGNLLGAEATAKELARLGLADALELTLLIARKDPRRHPRVAARWLLLYLEEDGEATIEEIVFAASCLAALTGNGYPEAAQAASRYFISAECLGRESGSSSAMMI